MSGNKILLDTNIALYLFKGDEDLGNILQDTEAYVSFINELELLGHKAINSTRGKLDSIISRGMYSPRFQSRHQRYYYQTTP